MWPYQVLGILCVVFCAFAFLISLATPKVYEGFDLTVRGPVKAMEVPSDTNAMEASEEMHESVGGGEEKAKIMEGADAQPMSGTTLDTGDAETSA